MKHWVQKPVDSKLYRSLLYQMPWRSQVKLNLFVHLGQEGHVTMIFTRFTLTEAVL